ncbi:MAG: DUF3987 domain-containing protein [Saprospiraceae bacterium]|nr:MAG: DUF3987 domain-containing protein [Saprospiraceae bacterium]
MNPKATRQSVVHPRQHHAAMFRQHLAGNGGSGILCETEADTLGNVLQQDWGKYSDLMRKCFSHEDDANSRKPVVEFMELESSVIEMHNFLAAHPTEFHFCKVLSFYAPSMTWSSIFAEMNSNKLVEAFYLCSFYGDGIRL